MKQSAETLALASLEQRATDAKMRADLLAEVVRTRSNRKAFRELFAKLLKKRDAEVAEAEAAATAAGIDLATVPAE